MPGIVVRTLDALCHLILMTIQWNQYSHYAHLFLPFSPFFIEIELTYNVINIEYTTSDSHFLKVVLHLYLMQNIVCIPCAVQYILVAYIFYM